MAEQQDSDDEWDAIERPAFVGSPRRPMTPEKHQHLTGVSHFSGELSVASVVDYTIERSGLRLCVTFVIQVITTQGATHEVASGGDNFDSSSSSFWTVRKEHNDFRELASAIVAELGPGGVDEVPQR